MTWAADLGWTSVVAGRGGGAVGSKDKGGRETKKPKKDKK
jgi:hypothetical protein